MNWLGVVLVVGFVQVIFGSEDVDPMVVQKNPLEDNFEVRGDQLATDESPEGFDGKDLTGKDGDILGFTDDEGKSAESKEPESDDVVHIGPVGYPQALKGLGETKDTLPPCPPDDPDGFSSEWQGQDLCAIQRGVETTLEAPPVQQMNRYAEYPIDFPRSRRSCPCLYTPCDTAFDGCPCSAPPYEGCECSGPGPEPCLNDCSYAPPLLPLRKRCVNVMEERMRYIPIPRFRIVPKVTLITRHVPVKRKFCRPVYERCITNIPITEKRVIPVVTTHFDQVPITKFHKGFPIPFKKKIIKDIMFRPPCKCPPCWCPPPIDPRIPKFGKFAFPGPQTPYF